MLLKQKETTLVIVGNGLDLNLGLKSSYGDFYKSDEFQQLLKKDKYVNKSADRKNWLDLEGKLYVTGAEDSGYEFPFEPRMLNELKIALSHYLINEINNLNKKTSSKNIKSHLKELNKNDSILSFNYTNTLRTVYSCSKNINYIHGKINEFHNNTAIVLGNSKPNIAVDIVDKIFSKRLQREILYFKRFCLQRNKKLYKLFCEEESDCINRYSNTAFNFYLDILNGLYGWNYKLAPEEEDTKKIFDDLFNESKADEEAKSDIEKYSNIEFENDNEINKITKELIEDSNKLKRTYIYDNEFKQWKLNNIKLIRKLKKILLKRVSTFETKDKKLGKIIVSYFLKNGFVPLRIKVKSQNGKYVNPDSIKKVEIVGHSLNIFDIEREKVKYLKRPKNMVRTRISSQEFLNKTFIDDQDILQEIFLGKNIKEIDYFKYKEDEKDIKNQLSRLGVSDKVKINFINY